MTAQIGRRVVVTGLPGSGKSTFAAALHDRAGLPLIHLDLAFWQPGWTAPAPDEWRVIQRDLLAGDDWIADGNYAETLDLRLALADTVVVMATPWPTCLRRALRRVVVPSRGEMPEGCEFSTWHRLRDEMGTARQVVRKRHREPSEERRLIEQHGAHTTVHVLSSPEQVATLLDSLD
ncbi:MAG: AAA family ATPase [Actinomycetota bacterium]